MPDAPMPDAPMPDRDTAFDRDRSGTRLRATAVPVLNENETLVMWTRGWISREGRYNVLLAARHHDFVVLTSQRLLLFSCGFFTRRPKRKVYEARLEHLEVADTGRHPGQRLRVTGFRKRPLRCEFGRDQESRAVVGALLDLD
jgi:hypothetical protein